MNRDFFFYGNLFLALGGAGGLLQSILYILIGPSILYLDSFLLWYVLSCIIWLAGTGFILKYFYFKDYQFAFVSGLTVALANSVIVILLYLMLLSRQQATPFYMSVLAFLLGALVLYGISLVFSRAGSSPWLKAAGILILATSLSLGAAILWARFDPQFRVSGIPEKVDQWSSLLRSLIPFAFMMQFSAEAKLLKKENDHATSRGFFENLFGFIGIAALAFTLILGVIIATEGFHSLYWKNHNAAQADELADKSEKGTFVNNAGKTLQYLLLKPLDYDPQKKYPLVVCLPYGEYEAPMAQLLSTDANRKLYPSFLFVPFSPRGSSWGGVPNKPAMDSLVYETLRKLDDPAIDEKRIYVSGVSLGGYGTWHFISTHPEMFAAAVPVCGEGSPSLAEKAADVPVWAFHGAKDKNVPVSGSRDMIEAIKNAGGQPRYTEFPDAAHGIWHQVTETPGMLDWLFQQRKSSEP